MELYDLVVTDIYGNEFTFNGNEDNYISEIHYCTSYFQFVVYQKMLSTEGDIYYKKKNLFYIHKNYENPIDLICIEDYEKCNISFKGGLNV